MPTGLRVYRLKMDGSVLAAEIKIGADGAARLIPGDEGFGELYEFIGDGVVMPVQRTFVPVTDGAAFIDAVEAVLSRSSVWGTSRVE
jgi:hypothetical protein